MTMFREMLIEGFYNKRNVYRMEEEKKVIYLG